MSWGPVFGSTLIVICMTLYQLPKINQNQKKEKAAFITLSIIGWLLAIMLIFFPKNPGPSEWIDILYKPLGKILE
jgi:hypothetical protein